MIYDNHFDNLRRYLYYRSGDQDFSNQISFQTPWAVPTSLPWSTGHDSLPSILCWWSASWIQPDTDARALECSPLLKRIGICLINEPLPKMVFVGGQVTNLEMHRRLGLLVPVIVMTTQEHTHDSGTVDTGKSWKVGRCFRQIGAICNLRIPLPRTGERMKYGPSGNFPNFPSSSLTRSV